MTRKSLPRSAALFSSGSLVLITGFLLAVGFGLVPVHLETVIAHPRWRLFVEICVLRVWSLWIATLLVALTVYCLVRKASGDRLVLPRGTKRIIIYVNAIVLLPATLAFDYFAGKAANAFSAWYWKVVFVIFLGGIVALISLLRRATRYELARRSESNEQ